MSRPSQPRVVLAGVAASLSAALLGAMTLGSHGHTYAAYSDFASRHASAQAAVWQPDPPSSCGDLSQYSTIVYGSPSDDVIDGTTGATAIVRLGHPGDREIIMGLGGNDRLRAGNGEDCIVGGAGNDHLAGTDASDVLDGGRGDDTCAEGLAADRTMNCERTIPALHPAQRGAAQNTDGSQPATGNTSDDSQAPSSRTTPSAPADKSAAQDPSDPTTPADEATPSNTAAPADTSTSTNGAAPADTTTSSTATTSSGAATP